MLIIKQRAKEAKDRSITGKIKGEGNRGKENDSKDKGTTRKAGRPSVSSEDFLFLFFDDVLFLPLFLFFFLESLSRFRLSRNTEIS